MPQRIVCGYHGETTMCMPLYDVGSRGRTAHIVNTNAAKGGIGARVHLASSLQTLLGDQQYRHVKQSETMTCFLIL